MRERGTRALCPLPAGCEPRRDRDAEQDGERELRPDMLEMEPPVVPVKEVLSPPPTLQKREVREHHERHHAQEKRTGPSASDPSPRHPSRQSEGEACECHQPGPEDPASQVEAIGLREPPNQAVQAPSANQRDTRPPTTRATRTRTSAGRPAVLVLPGSPVAGTRMTAHPSRDRRPTRLLLPARAREGRLRPWSTPRRTLRRGRRSRRRGYGRRERRRPGTLNLYSVSEEPVGRPRARARGKSGLYRAGCWGKPRRGRPRGPRNREQTAAARGKGETVR